MPIEVHLRSFTGYVTSFTPLHRCNCHATSQSLSFPEHMTVLAIAYTCIFPSLTLPPQQLRITSSVVFEWDGYMLLHFNL